MAKFFGKCSLIRYFILLCFSFWHFCVTLIWIGAMASLVLPQKYYHQMVKLVVIYILVSLSEVIWRCFKCFLGNYVYTYVIITVLIKISLETSTWTFWNWLSVIGSGFLWLVIIRGYKQASTGPQRPQDPQFTDDNSWFRILYVLMFGKFWPSIRILSPVHMAGQETQVFSSAVFWLGCLIIPFVTILRDVAYKV